MAGGFWGKGNNPYWNFDYDTSSRDRQMHRIQGEAQQEKLDHELDLQKAKNQNDADLSRMRIKMNATIASHKKEINGYEQRLDTMAKSLYKLALQSNAFYRTLVKLQEKWPEKKEDILDEIQTQRDYCNTDDYRNKWWVWANDFKKTPDENNNYFDFPFEKRPSLKK